MSTTNGKHQAGTRAMKSIRCGIYTRKSTEEGLEKEFNSLDAQRETAEAHIKSMAHEGWTILPHRYDDGGFTGGNMDRPGLKRLLMDIEAGRIDIVVTYKVDRLSRSLLDFTRVMDVFEKHQVSFVAFTQQINTANPMGRLMLNVLMSFAQFERELVSERTRDKIAAARRKGKWAGGHPILGYDIDPKGFKLIVNESEAVRVRTIFDLYLEHQALLPVVVALNRRGWANKRWATRKGPERGGKPFTKTSVHKILTNVAYVGQVRYKDEFHAGEQTPIITVDVWQRVQATLRRNAHSGSPMARNKYGAVLKGILRCHPCGCSMAPSHTKRSKAKIYRYYTCCSAQKKGWDSCPSKSIPAGEIERFVVDQIRCVGQDPELLAETLSQAGELGRSRNAEYKSELRQLDADMTRWHTEVRRISATGALDDEGAAVARLADLQERLRHGETRATQLREEIAALSREQVSKEEVAQALSAFDPVWESLTPQEQTRLVHLLVERVEYDGRSEKIAITFHPSGIKSLAIEMANQHEETIA